MSRESERYCEKCGQKETERQPLFSVEIPVSLEYFILCDPCIDDMVDWVEGEE